MATVTTNLGLTKPAITDFYDIGVQNTNMDLLDIALGGKAAAMHTHVLFGTCATAAGTAAKTVALENFSLVTGVMMVVKFSSNVTSSNSTLNVNGTGGKTIRYNDANLSTTEIRGGDIVTLVYDGTYWQVLSINAANGKMDSGYYNGTGTYGSSHKTTITVDFVPKMVMIFINGGLNVQTGSSGSTSMYPANCVIWINGLTTLRTFSGWNSFENTVSVSGTTFSFYHSDNEDESTQGQLNASGQKYYWVALG